ncbi:MAG: ferrous iron transporter B [Bdellovibrionales bacterium]
MDAIEGGIEMIAGAVTPHVGSQLLQDFLNDAIFGGFGAFLVFIPQIFILTFLVGLMEDSGYIARAAIICHRPLKFFGLTGKSFVPMLSGVACAIPGIYAARTIESPFRRWLTYFAIPLMPCSARLPVYALLIAAFIPAHTVAGGFIGLQGLVMFFIYFFGIVVGLLVTALLSRTRTVNNDSKTDIPFIIELPPYRLPGLKPLIFKSLQRSKLFVTKAGGIIFTVTVVVWFLGYFPNGGEDLGTSYLGYLGKFLEPIFQPLGLDWKYGVAILTSFLAREVFVGTLGTLFGIEGADENIAGLAESIQNSGLSFGSGIALIAFFAIAMQCVSTLAVLRRETGSWRMPSQIFIGYSLLAYATAYLATLIF